MDPEVYRVFYPDDWFAVHMIHTLSLSAPLAGVNVAERTSGCPVFLLGDRAWIAARAR